MVRLPGRMSKKPMDSEELVTAGPNPDQKLNRGRSGKCGEAVEMPIDQWRAQAAETYGTALITGFLKKKKRKMPEPPASAMRNKLVGPEPTPLEGMGELAPPQSKPLGSMLRPAPTAAAAELAAGEEKLSSKSRRKPAAKPKEPPVPKPEGPPEEAAAAQEDEEEQERRRKWKLQKVDEAEPEPEPEPEPEGARGEETEEAISAEELLQLRRKHVAKDPWSKVPDEDELEDDSWLQKALGSARYPLRNRRGRAETHGSVKQKGGAAATKSESDPAAAAEKPRVPSSLLGITPKEMDRRVKRFSR
ncbi:hypothetical protein KFL_010510030 [Klebsormidium nitens]|uniref:Uncharacterized protein n=1 Tax=Klebsormidium nitens TaxID=105231 RepID=A0A1Y1ISQ6_KLENI|nr:hypothetical protein KFL_010510030 [Klebsormidium nitens]|eukprot:GAQ92559.1 hypothetical protein KFL_010510030 [Klebsormidium nitens]